MRRPSLLIACACVLLALVATQATAAKFNASAQASTVCGFDGYDFSSLIGKDFVGKDGGDVYTYYLSLCGPLTSPAATALCIPNPDSAVSACQTKSGPNWSAAFVIGLWTPAPKWSFIDPANEFVGVKYTMIGAQQCFIDPDPIHPTQFNNYVANVELLCASSQGPLTVATAPRSCVQNFTMATPLACPPPAVERSIFLADE